MMLPVVKTLAFRHNLTPRDVETRILDALPRLMPKRWINHLTMGNLGRLTVRDPRLHTKEVLTITLQEVCGAIKYDEKGTFR